MTDQNKPNSISDSAENTNVLEDETEISNKNSRRKNSSDRSNVKRKRVSFTEMDNTDGDSDAQTYFEGACSSDTVEDVLEDMEEEIDNALEQTQYKNKLTPANVKNILRHIIANEYVLAMVRNTMKLEHSDGEELGDHSYEPKLTRSKAKEMRKKQYTLPWPVSSPVKKVEKVSQQLLEEEFPDESSSDEDYKPIEEESPSDDDEVLASSPKQSNVEEFHKIELSSCSTIPEIMGPLSEKENSPAVEFQAVSIPENASEADKIALRTRSKLCLNDTPLEEIEASFIAPDITIDMYDTKCDDEEWQEFLRELCKPIEHPEEADDAEDPEYKVLEEDVPDYNDLRYDNSVKITRGELNALMAEILEFAQQELGYFDDEEDEENRSNFRGNKSPVVNVGPVSVENVQSQWMNADERLQLDEQMRMYVQILAQSYLLSHGNSHLNFINVSSKLFLDEIKMFASREMATNERSAFYAQNLDGALDIVNEYENRKVPLKPRNVPQMKKTVLPPVPQHVKKTLATSKVFIYPELLPVCGFREVFEKQKTKFSTPEDNLIALGMEQFADVKNPIEFIHALLVPAKTIEQIKIRIKNSKVKKNPMDNPIKFYHVYKQAPQFQRVIRIFDPYNIKAPEDYAPEFLPKWMESYSKVGIHAHITPLIAPTPTQDDAKPKIAVVRPMFRKPLEARKLSPILPRGFSPLKHISPILKKYSQQRRIVPILPFNCNSPLKRKYPPQRQFAKPFIKPAPDPSGIVLKPDVLKESFSRQPFSSIRNGISENQDENTEENQNSSSTLTECVSFSSINQMTEQVPSEQLSIPIDSHAGIEILDEADEEIAEEEQDVTTSAASTNSTNGKKQVVSKKRNRLQRDLEASLALLQPTLLKKDSKKEEREVLFANSYLLRASEILKGNPEIYENFLSVLCKYHQSTRPPVELYKELKEVLKDYPTLVRDFIIFLKPEQAKECGKYKEHVALSRIREFFWKIEVHFKHQPQYITRILRTFAQLQQQIDITSAEVITALQPLLRNQSHLMEELYNLLPDVNPPEYLMTDFEAVNMPNSDEDNSSVDSCEDIVIPDIPDPYGGKDCPCDCHNSSSDNRMLNKSRHCVKCGVRFIDGRIYIQTGKVLKPAQVTYHDLPLSNLPEKDKINGHPMALKVQSSPEIPVKTTIVAAEVNEKNDIIASKLSNGIQKSILCDSEEPLISNCKLPCDVIEDTVFPAVMNSLNKSTPSDFSHLKDMIGSSASQNSIKKTTVSSHNVKWTRDEDRLIIYNCQRYGISRKAFSTSASAIKNRTTEEVEERFLSLMELLSEEMKKQ
ncbi:GON-4-like protein [Trichonephila inaurata madagascariensis]|uniref:GON-4-like protein n=1 Tax=Trichonephila inaurata madagascariensis TaxID=2747483 RepID=A0A8X6X163_9ARAC|nr:GON-4-like protein [Trichonephila inaurata madagascariensis]